MSIPAINWARRVRGISSTQKLVLWSLADQANDANECWPSVIGTAKDCCLTDRAVRASLRALEKAGLIVADCGGGRHRTTRYRLCVTDTETRNDVPPFRRETRNDVPETRNHIPETRNDVPPNPKEPSGTTSKRERRGSRLPDAWTPTPDDRGFAEGLGLDADKVAASFRDYWHSATGAKATKADWSATWRNWCRRDAERKPRAHAERPGKLDWLWREMRAENDGDPFPDLLSERKLLQ